ncbi:DUF6883 domain-containing protein [Flindersiella endophytica]
MSGYWRTSGVGNGESSDGRRDRRSRSDERADERGDERSEDNDDDNDGNGDDSSAGRADGPVDAAAPTERAGLPFGELSVEEQADRLRGPQLPEAFHLDLAREWKDHIDRELELQIGEQAATLPEFGPVLQGLGDPVIAHDTIYRPGMDPDDPDGQETAEAWTDLGYSLQVKGYRPLYAENLAYLLRVQLASARIESTEDTDDGTIYQLRTGLIGENGRHAILVSRWLLRHGRQRPELLRVWPEPFPELPSGDSA